MKKLTLFLLVFIFITASVHADIKIVAVKGDVQVRRGVNEQWLPAASGDVLKPEDSMKSGKKSSAVIVIDGKNKIAVPELVIIDCSDLRKLTQEQLLLMLAMESVRSVPTERRQDELTIPRTTTIHGESQEAITPTTPTHSKAGFLQLNGTKVLYSQGFYATCVLKAKEVFRLNPDLMNMIEMRFMVANAFERMELNGEALGEYRSLTRGHLTSQQRSLVEQKISQLGKKNKG